MIAALILANQLSANNPAIDKADIVLMIEADDLCRKLPYHQHKLVLLLSGMRHYAEELRQLGKTVVYREHQTASRFLISLAELCTAYKVTELRMMQPFDWSTDRSIADFCKQNSLTLTILDNNSFLSSQVEFSAWYHRQKSPRMENFYRQQRRRLGYLMAHARPLGGEWNYDQHNRKPLPKRGLDIPKLPSSQADSQTTAVIDLVQTHFSEHPGQAAQFWLPVSRDTALEWLQSFLIQRFAGFGPYEDAMAADEPFLFHSVLSPLINIGLLSPQECVEQAIEYYEQNNSVSLATVEGFVRQLIGWREYMAGIYREEMPAMKHANFFGFSRELEDWWYSDQIHAQNIPEPVKRVALRVQRWGYAHHIERLMVLGNWFLLNEYNPQSVNRWFTAMFVDAYDWVMVPNVIGMSQYADGGRLASKPYIAGGNYLQKMGRWFTNNDEAKASEFTRLYWNFLYRHRSRLANNPRMALTLKNAANYSELAKPQV